MNPRMPSAALDVKALLADPGTRIVVCCGSGGVGKTTTAAALALRGAESGRRTVVLTIDPARRLAQALGLTELDNTPRRVSGVGKGGGELHAMMLDMKRTFDEVVLAHSTPDKAGQIFKNPFYQAMSSSFSGTQEYMAMEKLGQLRTDDSWDLIVVDTPPSRSALDFLDAPQRLSRFLDGRMLRLLLAPAKKGGRAYLKVVQVGVGFFSRVITRILGAQLLKDLSAFVAAMDTMFGGFRERAQQTYELLQQPGTAFLVVAAPEPDALREASYFADRLAAEHMPLAGLVLNRMHRARTELSAERSLSAAQLLESAAQKAGAAEGTSAQRNDAAAGLTAAVLRVHADRVRLAAREQRLARRFRSAHPTVAVAEVAALGRDVHDLPGLRDVVRELLGS